MVTSPSLKIRIASSLAIFFVLGIGAMITRADGPDLQMFATTPYGPNIWPQLWTPVKIVLQNDTPNAVAGQIWFPARDHVGPARIIIPADVPAHSRYQTFGYAYFPVSTTPPVQSKRNAPPARQPPSSVMVEWRSNTGERMARAEMLAVPVGTDQTFISSSPSEVILTVDDHGDLNNLLPPPTCISEQINTPASLLDDAYQNDALGSAISADANVPAVNWISRTADLPRSPVGYDSVRLVVFMAQNPDNMDPAQRKALLEYLAGGGRMLIPAPMAAADGSGFAQSWLGRYLPVHLIGVHLASSLDYLATDPLASALPAKHARLNFRLPLNITEATPAPEIADAKVLLQDHDYVSLASIPIGLGRIVFASFAANGLTLKTEALQQFWRGALDLDARSVTWSSTRLAGEARPILQSMVGLTVPPWRSAMAITGAFALLVLIAQFAWRGASRPRAFAVVTLLSVLFAAALVVARAVRSSDRSLSAAGLTTIDLSGQAANRGGLRQESLCLLGDASDLSLSLSQASASIRPTGENADNPPAINELPFSVRQPQVNADHVNDIWHAVAPVPPNFSASAEATFGPAGLQITTHNNTGSAITASLLLCGNNHYRLPTIPTGDSQLTVTNNDRNEPGGADSPDTAYRNTSDVVSTVDLQRSHVLRAASTPPSDSMFATLGVVPTNPQWTIAGFIDAGDASIIQPSQPILHRQEIALIRFPATLQPSPVGTHVLVDGGFVQMTPAKDAMNIPFDRISNTWIDSGSSQPGEWLISFAPPPQVGKLVIHRATLRGSVSLPQWNMTLQRGQVSKGKPQLNPSGPMLAQWSGVYGRQSDIAYDISDTDVDADGRVWLLLNVNRSDDSMTTHTLWTVKELGLSLEGDAVDLQP
jgi:hypothetical protein